MKTNKKRSLIGKVLALAMILNLFLPAYMVRAEGEGTGGADKTSVLTNISVVVKQNGEEITGDTLPSTDNISIEVSFRVPTAGDWYKAGNTEPPDSATIVQEGDWADIALGAGFTLSAVSGEELPIELNFEGGTVGHVTAFNTDAGTKEVTAHVVFDGEDVDFENDSGITAGFQADLELDDESGSGGGETSTFTILEKTYTITPPPAEIAYTVTKTGTPDLANKCINWTVDITATQGDTKLDLAGYTFSDDLTNVGTYEEDSFQVGTTAGGVFTPDDPAGTLITPSGENNNTLSYTFPEGSVSPKTVKFQTGLTNAQYYAATEQTVTNTAQLKKGGDVVKEGSDTVTFTPEWIKKEGKVSYEGSSGVYNPKNRTITWTITANQMGATLTNAYITDLLPEGLELVVAKAQTGNGSDWTDMDPKREWTTAPTDGKYELGTISTQILLTIETKVPDADYAAGITTYKNSAKIGWENGPGNGIGTGDIGVGVGYNAIGKAGVLDPKTGIVTWTVTVDTGNETIPNLKVHDLLAYGKDSTDLTGVTGIPDGVEPQYNQKYIDESFQVTNQSNEASLKIEKTLLNKGGTSVADLLEITGFVDNAPNKAVFIFKTKVVNPDIYAGNITQKVWNTATLFSANAKLNAAADDVSYPSHMLAKEMLERGADPTKADDVNNKKTTDAGKGFDYVDKSVIFRLSVNADGLDLTNARKADATQTDGTIALGPATLTDTLPEGWVFDKINGKDFLIFAGTPGSDKSVTATGSVLDTVGGLSADFTTTAGTAKFTFSALNQPYVILVKARPVDPSKYFDANEEKTETNNLTLQTKNWAPGVSASQNVKITSTLLSKNLDTTKGEADETGELHWTVVYNPYQLNGNGTKLEDTLPDGIELRTDSTGKLILEGNITINQLTLQANGEYDVGAPITPVLDGEHKNVSYDSASRLLTFYIPDSTQAYQFIYLTDITGEPETGITNTVKLIGGSGQEVKNENAYTISEAAGWATLKRGGSLTITKKDGSDAALAGAEFTLYALNESSEPTTVIRRGKTAENGTLKFRAIPVGKYILRETGVPEHYRSDGRDYSVEVTESGSTITTSIDKKTGEDSNKLTVKNYANDTTGDLTISKTVAGNAADKEKLFEFTVTFDGASGTYDYIGSGVPNGTIASGETVSLAHGQSIKILGLPKGATYTVTETDYSAERYSVTSTGAEGTIVADTTQTASFTNTRNNRHNQTGNLTISKTVTGSGADTSKKFQFTVTFDGADGAYPYTGIGVEGGTVRSGDTVSLAHGQSITITGLPDGASYQVSEQKDAARGYSVESTGSSGTISAGTDRTAAFINTKLPSTGSLTIRKTVTGQGADLQKKFDFKLTLTGAPDAYPYTGASDGTLRSGDTVSLADGQSITITGLPKGAEYAVTEADYTEAGYAASSTGAEGVILADAAQTASFTNAWGGVAVSPETPGNSGENIGGGDIPKGTLEGENPSTVDNGGNVPKGAADPEKGVAMPKTGDDRKGGFARICLVLLLAAFAALSAADLALRKKHAGKRNRP